jgi:hypothetical protein
MLGRQLLGVDIFAVGANLSLISENLLSLEAG